MRQCEECRTQKKADNCIRCAVAERARAEKAERTLDEVKVMLEMSPSYELQYRLREYLNGR